MIKAIETEYNGYKFRSRLEARWAVFFDAVGIKYEYEPEGFQLDDDLFYLPDFYLPELDLWIEVKGIMSEEDAKKINKFCTKYRMIVLKDIPNPEEPDIVRSVYDNYPDADAFYYEAKDCWDFPYLPCVCPACGRVGFEFDGRGWRICNHLNESKEYTEQELLNKKIYVDKDGNVRKMRYPQWAGCRMDDKGYSADHPLIIDAYKKARQARFEHGEYPNTTY